MFLSSATKRFLLRQNRARRQESFRLKEGRRRKKREDEERSRTHFYSLKGKKCLIGIWMDEGLGQGEDSFALLSPTTSGPEAHGLSQSLLRDKVADFLHGHLQRRMRKLEEIKSEIVAKEGGVDPRRIPLWEAEERVVEARGKEWSRRVGRRMEEEEVRLQRMREGNRSWVNSRKRLQGEGDDHSSHSHPRPIKYQWDGGMKRGVVVSQKEKRRFWILESSRISPIQSNKDNETLTSSSTDLATKTLSSPTQKSNEEGSSSTRKLDDCRGRGVVGRKRSEHETLFNKTNPQLWNEGQEVKEEVHHPQMKEPIPIRRKSFGFQKHEAWVSPLVLNAFVDKGSVDELYEAASELVEVFRRKVISSQAFTPLLDKFTLFTPKPEY